MVTIVGEIVERGESARLDVHRNAIDRLGEQVRRNGMSCDRVGECGKPWPGRVVSVKALSSSSRQDSRPGLIGGATGSSARSSVCRRKA